MPILDNNGNPVKRIRFDGDKEIYRVIDFDTGELRWGLFNINYNVGPGSVTKKPSQFVWGIEENLPTPTCSNLPSNANNVTFGGWYDNKNLSGSRITKVLKTQKQDLNIYAKWVATATQYRVTYRVQTGISGGGGGGGFSPIGNNQSAVCYDGDGVGIYDWNSSYIGWCSWFVSARLKQVGASYAPVLNGNGWAKQSVYPIVYDPQPGYLAGWYGGELDNHIAFIESINPTVYSQNRNRDTSTNTYTWWTRTYGNFSGAPDYYVKTDVSSGGGGGGEPIYENRTTDWQWSNSAPEGEYVSSESRTVYSYYNYNTNNWTEWSTSQL